MSAVSGRRYRRPVALAAAAREASVSPHVNIAQIDLGPLPGVQLADDQGNPENHDELLNPGLDDSRFATLRTWNGRPGVYVNRPLVLCPLGSDFIILPYVRVMNLAIEIYLQYLEHVLSRPLLVDQKTGYILESEARRIEQGATQAGKAVLGAAPMVSSSQVTVARDDDILRTEEMNCEADLVPLAYPQKINLRMKFVAPVRAA
jgi:hypothetical protein